ncbi:hypothetical protein C2E23DRAFT_807004 [Lenzites betulinus]|nr:hypothetical protein C2E23DRAFT_807004 [Lenzites betulinus]
MQHQYGCDSIGLCTPDMHVQLNYGQLTIGTPSEWSTHTESDDNPCNSAWIPRRGVDDYLIQTQSDWVDDTTLTWYRRPVFAYNHPDPQATLGLEPIPTAYWDFNGATQYPELYPSSDLPFEQASSNYQPMAAAYWDYEASSMEYNRAEWDMNTTATDLYSSDVEATDINKFDWFGVSGLDELVSQHGRNMGVGTLGGFAIL